MVLPPVPLYKPRSWEVKSLETKKLALASIFTALYAILILTFAGVSFELIQVRIADALIPLSIIFGWPVVVGVSIGCFVSNIISPMPSVLIEITLGSMANLIASTLAWKIGNLKQNRISEFLGCSIATITITFIVGTYLSMITGMPYLMWWTSIFIGSAISINVIGYILIQVLRRLGMRD